jgi:hypothetical protein
MESRIQGGGQEFLLTPESGSLNTGIQRKTAWFSSDNNQKQDQQKKTL